MIKQGIFGLLLSLLVSSCGIEDYLFLDPVPDGSITSQLVERATINLPSIGSDNFTHFAVYYRIYISGTSLESVNEGNMSTVNPTLYSDYSAILPYTRNDSNSVNTAIGSLFSGRSYRTLVLEESYDDIDEVLDKDSFGGTLVLDFTQVPGATPVLTLNDQSYPLYRSNGEGLFTILPQNDRRFLNFPELNNSANISSTTNADVANNTSLAAGDPRYTYVAFYIVVVGIDSNASPIYSAPAYIGVLRLPETSTG
jgi:hypothetical protein